MTSKLALIILLALPLVSYSQDPSVLVFGRIVDKTDGSLVIGATVQLYNIKDSTQSKYSITDTNGIFQFPNVDRAFYKLNVKSLGYKPYTKTVRVTNLELNFGNVYLEQDIRILEGLEVKGEVVAMEVKGDTVLYNAEAYTTNPDATTLDLVTKMPGIVVDNSGVTANGESIEQVLLDGKKFFGQDPLLSLNTLPAEVVDRIEVYDQKSEVSQFTGYDDGNTTKTMNVVTKENKRNGQFGNIYAGYGSDDRYKAGATLNSFKGSQRLTILGMSNNINQQNFSSEDLAGVSGGGGRRGGFRRGNSSLLTGTQDGITQTNALGINFNNEWNDKLSLEGSYFLNMTGNTNDQITSRETFLGDSTQFYDETNNSDTDNMNHRLNARINYEINDNNRLVIRPRISYQDNESLEYTLGQTTNESGELINQTENNYTSSTQAWNLQNDISLIHKFEKIGRSVSLELETDYSTNNNNNDYVDLELDSMIQYSTDRATYKLGTKVGYSEPVGASSLISANYEISYDERYSNKDTYFIEPESEVRTFSDALSNHFTSKYITQKPKISFIKQDISTSYNFELGYQHIELQNEQLIPEVDNFNNSFSNFMPSAMIRGQIGSTRFFARYRTSTDIPTVNQLQNVIDNSNPLFISLGNPSLKQGYTHDVMFRINSTNTDKNRSLSNFLRVQKTNNYITDEASYLQQDSIFAQGVVVQQGAQVSKPVNLDGYWSVSNNTTHSISIKPIKSNLNTSIGLRYTRQPGITNDILNYANTYTGNVKLSLASNINENVDFNLYYNVSTNSVVNSLQEASNSSYTTQTVGGKTNLIFGNGFVFRNDIYYEKYNGLDDSFDSQYILWNMSLAKKFLKNDLGELELSVFDLLSQNQSFSQNVRPAYVEEIRTEVLQQYFMLTFTYKIRHFKK